MVPNFFCITTTAFKRALGGDTHIGASLTLLQAATDDWCKAPSNEKETICNIQAAALREEICRLSISREVQDAVFEAFTNLAEGDSNISCAVRSSATTEDTAEASFAGQHDTFLHQRGILDVIDSMRRCWASIFTDRAVLYRARNGIFHADAVMCVVVQKMITPVVAGTAFSVELNSSYPAMHVCASWGLGEAVVSGNTTGDEWLLDKKDQGLRVIKQSCGSKHEEFVAVCGGKSGIEVRPVEAARRDRFCLGEDSVKSVAGVCRRIAEAYRELFGYENMDTEFAVTFGEEGKAEVHMLQARPVVVVQRNVLTAEPAEAALAEVILRGQYSLLGSCTGKLKVLLDFEQLADGSVSIQPDDILVTSKTSNVFNSYLTNLRGICTFEGSATAHPMLIGRERGLPVVCGVPGANQSLLKKLSAWNGATVTLDGLTRSLYAGTLKQRPLTAAEFEQRFVVVKVESPPPDAETFEFLKLYKRLHVDESDGSGWVFNPNAHLSPIWCEIRLASYDKRWQLIDREREEGVANPFLGTQTRILEFAGGVRKVADRLVPVAQTMAAFAGWSLAECQAFHDRCERASEAYISACEDFAREATVAKWRSYTNAAAIFYSAGWLSYFFRMFVNEHLTSVARSLGVSQLHYEGMLALLQRQCRGEDDEYQDALRKCALEMLPILQGRQGSKRPQLLCDVELMARTFRAEKETDIARPMPLEMVLHTVLETAYRLSQSPEHRHTDDGAANESGHKGKEEGAEVDSVDADEGGKRDADSRIKFFPSEPLLHRWARLSIAARVQMSSSHHLKVRGQNRVKEELLRVARCLELAVWGDILECESVEKMETFLAQYELLPNKHRGPPLGHSNAHSQARGASQSRYEYVAATRDA